MLDLKTNPEDINTYSNFHEINQKSVYLDVSIDLENNSMFGTIKTTYSIINQSLENIILDLHGPEIISVSCINDDLEKINLDYYIYDKNKDKDSLGTPLVINLLSLKKKIIMNMIKYIRKRN